MLTRRCSRFSQFNSTKSASPKDRSARSARFRCPSSVALLSFCSLRSGKRQPTLRAPRRPVCMSGVSRLSNRFCFSAARGWIAGTARDATHATWRRKRVISKRQFRPIPFQGTPGPREVNLHVLLRNIFGASRNDRRCHLSPARGRRRKFEGFCFARDLLKRREHCFCADAVLTAISMGNC